MKGRSILFSILLLAFGTLLGIWIDGQTGWGVRRANAVPQWSGAASSPPARVDPDFINNMNAAFTSIAREVNPSVVTIFIDKVLKTRQQPFGSPFSGSPFGGFFGDDFWRQFGFPQAPQKERHLRGMGSGVIVSADGYILTNNHVVQGADEIKVMLPGGEKVNAKVVGADKKTDVAVVKIDRKGLRPIRLGDSDKLEVGEWVLAIGSPLSENLAHTVTSGIVSAKGRSNVGLSDYEDFIQTDAAINPGNSGGALCNLHGDLVGINTAIVSQTGGFQGIGFAVPVNMAREVMQALIEHGKVVRGWLGVSIQDVTEQIAQAMKLPVRKGALVAEVSPGSPADKAGLKAEDVILAFDGKPVESSTQLRNEVAGHAPGSKATLKILRDGEEKQLTVTLGELPEESVAAASSKQNANERLGLRVQTLDRQLAGQLGLNRGTRGVVVTAIDPNSNAYAAGVRRGMLITSVNRTRVTDAGAFDRAVSQIKSGETVLLYATMRGQSFFIAFEAE